MKTKYILISIAVIAVLVGLRLGINRLQEQGDIQTVQSSSPESMSQDELPSGEWASKPATPNLVESQKTGVDDAEAALSAQLIQEYGFDSEKIAALRASRDGDPRTPPLKRREYILPTPEELSDPQLYLQYEQRQNQQAMAGFVKAVDPKVNQIKAHMEAIKDFEVPDREKYQRIADEKIAALEKMKAELLAKNPELANIETPLLDLSSLSESSVPTGPDTQ